MTIAPVRFGQVIEVLPDAYNLSPTSRPEEGADDLGKLSMAFGRMGALRKEALDARERLATRLESEGVPVYVPADDGNDILLLTEKNAVDYADADKRAKRKAFMQVLGEKLTFRLKERPDTEGVRIFRAHWLVEYLQLLKKEHLERFNNWSDRKVVMSSDIDESGNCFMGDSSRIKITDGSPEVIEGIVVSSGREE